LVEFISFFVDNPAIGSNGIFFGLFICVSYYCRKDSNENKEDLKEMNERMFDVVNNNTKTFAELAQIIKDRIK